MKNDDVIKTKIADILIKNKVQCFRAIPCPRCDTYEDVFDLLLSEIKREREEAVTDRESLIEKVEEVSRLITTKVYESPELMFDVMAEIEEELLKIIEE